jgi:hypothetical protein
MPVAVSLTTALVSALVVLALIAVPYWVLYRIFGNDEDGED